MRIKQIVYLFAALLSLSFLLIPGLSGAASFREAGIHHQKGVTCADCHKVERPKEAANYKSCLACHGPYEKLAKRTGKLEVNPHDSHLGPIECPQCHGVHEPVEMKNIPCIECHGDFTFNVK